VSAPSRRTAGAELGLPDLSRTVRGNTLQQRLAALPRTGAQSNRVLDRNSDLKRRNIFVIGAGLSTEFRYPMARDLLHRVWARLPSGDRKVLERIVRFHHPGWDGRPATLPDIEEFLTELAANEDLLPALRAEGPFNRAHLRQARDKLLFEIARWFHEIHSQERARDVLRTVVRRIKAANAAIISFNWDYELDQELFDSPTSTSYGIAPVPTSGIVLLKPHGSLNWYTATSGRHIKERLLEVLWTRGGEHVYHFRPWRAPRSTVRQYLPWIVPPTHVKEFGHPMLRRIWRRCVDVLSTARTVYFLGYSLPAADWHSRYILRCGFDNQVQGLPWGKRRRSPTGPAKVTIVNPDPSAFTRIEAVVGAHCRWVPKRISDWLGA